MKTLFRHPSITGTKPFPEPYTDFFCMERCGNLKNGISCWSKNQSRNSAFSALLVWQQYRDLVKSWTHFKSFRPVVFATTQVIGELNTRLLALSKSKVSGGCTMQNRTYGRHFLRECHTFSLTK